jgi:sugar phosphate permease
MTVSILVVAPVAGGLTGRVPLRVPLCGGLVLFGIAATLMHVDPADEWTAVLPEMMLAGVAVGLISPALASAMVAVLPVSSSGRASGINNTFRQLGIAIGIAGLGAIFDHHVERSTTGIVDGLNAVLVVSAAVAFASAALGWLLLGRRRPAP